MDKDAKISQLEDEIYRLKKSIKHLISVIEGRGDADKIDQNLISDVD